MTKQELMIEIQNAGFESAHLDDTVYFVAHIAANDANMSNDIGTQVTFLIDTCGWDPNTVWETIIGRHPRRTL